MPGIDLILTYSDASTSSTNTIWTSWNAGHAGLSATSATGSSTISTNIIWTNWVTSSTATFRGVLGESRQAIREPTPEEIQSIAESKKAKERAQKLLNSCLTGPQREQLKDKNYFELDVLSPMGEPRRYRIERKWAGSVHRVNRSTGRVEKTLCIHPRISTPIEDSMLAQKLMLESGMEEQLLQTANHWN